MREPSQDSILPTPIPEKQKGPQLLSVLVASLPILPSFLLVVILFPTSRATEASNLPETCIN